MEIRLVAVPRTLPESRAEACFMRGRRIRGATFVCLSAIAGASACSHAWGDLDPTATSSSSSATGTGGSGGDTVSSTTTSSGTGGDTSSSTSSSSGTGGATPVHCGGTDILSWDFSDDQWAIWDGYGNIDVTNGEGIIALDASATDWSSAAMMTHRRYDFRGDRISLEVLEIPDQSDDAYGFVQLEYPGDDRIYMDVWRGHLECAFRHDGNDSVPMDQVYDPVQHRFWQLREDKGTVYCETSPDGSSWKSAGSFPLAPSLLAEPSNMRVRIAAVTPGNLPSPGVFRFDNLNGGKAPTGSWCPIKSYTDDFAESADVPGPAWQRWYTSTDTDSINQSGGTVNFHFGKEEDSSVGYGSSGSYDMTGQRVTLQILQLPTSMQGEAYFSVGHDGTANIFWTMTAGGLECAYDGPDIDYHTIWKGQMPSLPAWLGFREEDGRVFCEVLEGGTWQPYGSANDIIDPKQLDVYFGATSYSGLQLGSHLAVMDGYNLAPVP